MDEFLAFREQERIKATLITRAEVKLKALLGTFAAVKNVSVYYVYWCI
ncbi:hypothetical protein [Vibrio spartinae]|uniref:Uncharacterized protein n=1 Tax=Vibrio spartinae TaxID=1918945 RepID=A0A1N6MAZ2_9VIBR|nr:hypothetical protein [Vibrio spartinae]SIO96527.1 hypothetical protein VSP9026_04330 [Vibrio spartinae]